MISLVLATYNGGGYLRQQLDSLSVQTLLPSELIVGDDGSQDDTCKIVEEFAASSPFPVRLVRSAGDRLGASGNFARLLELVRGDYLMLCDQDDVWFPDKVQRSLAKLQELESVCGRTIPCLVHTDMAVADAEGRVIASSFWGFQNLDPQCSLQLRTSLAQNVATGCTMLLNRALLLAVVPLPVVGPLMHDWWLVLACHVLGGQVSILAESTMQYRQHGKNSIGAKPWRVDSWLRRMFDPVGIREHLLMTQHQAFALLARYGESMAEGDKLLVSGYASLAVMGWFSRRRWLWRHRVIKSGWQRTLGLYLYV